MLLRKHSCRGVSWITLWIRSRAFGIESYDKISKLTSTTKLGLISTERADMHVTVAFERGADRTTRTGQFRSRCCFVEPIGLNLRPIH